MQRKLESGGCAGISEKTHAFSTALRSSFIRWKENKTREKQLLSTVFNRHSRHFPL